MTTTTTTHRSARGKRILQGIVSVAVVAGIFIGVMPRIADYGDVWATIRAMTSLEVIALVAVGVWNLVTYWFVLVAVLPGLSYGQAAIANQASTAISNTVPGGGAIGVGVTYAMYSSWGFSGADVTRSVVVSGIWNTFIKLGLPVAVLPLLAFDENGGAGLVMASLIGVAVLVVAIVVFALMLRSDRLAGTIGGAAGRVATTLRRVVRRPPVEGWRERARAFRSRTADLLAARWVRLTVSAIVSHLSLFVVLLIALRNVGVSQQEVSWIHALAAFAFVRLISALPITPGGVGVVELGYAAAMSIGVDEITRAQIVAAVLAFRFITYVLPVPFGALSYLYWRRNRRWRHDVGKAAHA
jgi:uncharacterized protein (TIRG00374 family)